MSTSNQRRKARQRLHNAGIYELQKRDDSRFISKDLKRAVVSKASQKSHKVACKIDRDSQYCDGELTAIGFIGKGYLRKELA